MKRPLLLLLLALPLGCASPTAQGDLPTWSPTRLEVEPKSEQVFLQALILEVPARGPTETRSSSLEMGVLNEALGTAGVRVLQSPSLITTPDKPASLFVGENFAGESVGLRLEFENKGDGNLSGTFILTDLKKDGTPYKAADASFELKVGGPPLMVEVPGQRFVPVGDESVLQERVFLIVIEGRQD